MIEVFKFIFSSFWIWLGTLILIICIIESLPILKSTKNKKIKYAEWIVWQDEEENTWECSECGEPYILMSGNPTENR